MSHIVRTLTAAGALATAALAQDVLVVDPVDGDF